MTLVGDRVLPWLEKALDLSARRHDLLAANVANSETANYVPRDLEFHGALAQELDHQYLGFATDGVRPTDRRQVGPRLDKNRVDLEQEVIRLASNKAFHELATEVVSRRLALMRYSIDEGGRS